MKQVYNGSITFLNYKMEKIEFLKKLIGYSVSLFVTFVQCFVYQKRHPLSIIIITFAGLFRFKMITK
jgi:hypothetical protein